MKKYVVLILALIMLTGCSKSEPTLKNDEIKIHEAVDKKSSNINDLYEKNHSNNKVDSIDNSIEKVDDNEGKIKSPLTGLYIEEEKLNDRPIAVMIDNYYKARPQAGLSEADVIYEILAEGNITRYLAIIYSSKPETIGPVRSARPYFIDKALEYDPLYIHVGGSPEALQDVKSLKMADIDALACGKNTFWRKKHKPIPNNMYTSYSALIKEANRKKYKTSSKFETLLFNERDIKIEGKSLEFIKFPYRKSYISEFRYNKDDRLYYRYVNNKPHKDEVSGVHLTAKNIIIQYANSKVIDNKGRLEIDLIGQGKGLYITDGKMMEITWKKNDRRDLTRFYDLNGNEIKFNPGITWHQVVPSTMKIIMN